MSLKTLVPRVYGARRGVTKTAIGFSEQVLQTLLVLARDADWPFHKSGPYVRRLDAAPAGKRSVCSVGFSALSMTASRAALRYTVDSS